MERSSFLALLTAAALGDLGRDDRAIPVELRGGRFFAIPRTLNGEVFACWLDTDGRGFIFEEAAERFGLAARVNAMQEMASLPTFAPAASIPPLSRADVLPVFVRDAAARADPILQGFDAQLGGSWFADRVWELNFARGSASLLSRGLAAGAANVPLRFGRGIYPRVTFAVEGRRLALSFDIAASLAVRKAGSQRIEVVATSFVSRALFAQWKADHPDWRVERNVSSTPGIDRITVPQVGDGAVALRNVEFTTRPSDDVFQGGDVAAKLGANAYAKCVVTIDYPNARLRISNAS
ncbi:MAG: hypothetical protein JO092_00295 [Candidatus Eremiobacteraeota bacterium]|nr:hypothetical protein [Candidatus Eremiobacteraeota bacterium]